MSLIKYILGIYFLRIDNYVTEELIINMEKVINIGVIILNYLAYKETINCINDFKEQNKENINLKIIVVDNHSYNDSYKILKETFKNDEFITIVKTVKNIGFARGNNYGYYELLKYMKPEFVIISNDDIIIKQNGLFDWIKNCYKKYNFSLLGPSIYSKRGKYYQNPMGTFERNKNQVIKLYYKNKFKIIYLYLKKLFNTSQSDEKINCWENNYFNQIHFDKALHGSFQIFSSIYFKYYKEPYHPGTYFYFEEDILKLRCDLKNLKMVYDPTFKIEHIQAVSTDLINKSVIDKDIFRLKNITRSLKVYIKLLKEL